MAFEHGKNTAILVNEFDASPFLAGAELSRTTETADVTTFGSDDMAYIPGIRDAAFSFDGFFDSVADASFEQIFGTGANNVLYYPGGLAAGRFGKAGVSLGSEQVISTNIGEAIAENVAFQVSDQLERVTALTAIDTFLPAGASAAVDGVAASSNGLVGWLSLQAFTGTDITVEIQDSADGLGGWATVLTFTTQTGTAFERLASGAISVDRYLRVVANGTFTTADLHVSFRRL